MKLREQLLVLSLLTAGAVALPAQEVPQPGHRSVFRIALHAVGGAIVGAWGGYVASQVAWSDWREGEGRGAQRIRFSISGAAIGLLGGVLIGARRGTAAPFAPPKARAAQPAAPGPITEDQIRASSARTVSELLRRLRPQWLRSRGEDVLRPNQDQLAAHGVRVYLNGELLGGLDALDDVSIDALTGVEFLDAAKAILRWGAGHDDGAILLITSPDS